MTEPSAALATLRARVADVFRAHGLELWQVGFFPDESGLRFHIVGGAADDEAPSTDDGFDDVIASARAAEREAQSRSAIDDLTRRLTEGDGFL